MKKKLLACAICTSLAFSSGCENLNLNKESLGTAIGGVAGALAGSQVGKGKGRKIAILTGAILGAYVGNRIGSHLDEQDRIALQQRSVEVLNQTKDDQPIIWKSSQTNASATITPSNSRKETRSVSIVRDKRVEPVSNMTLIGKPYRAVKSVNIRNMPSTVGDKVGGLNSGDVITAVGRTKSGWTLVAKNNITLGYVSSSFLKPHSAASSSGKYQAVAMRDGGVTLEQVKKDQSGAIDLDSVNLDDIDLVEDRVVTQTDCRNVDYKITNKGKETTETFNACKGADGAWEII